MLIVSMNETPSLNLSPFNPINLIEEAKDRVYPRGQRPSITCGESLVLKTR